MIVTRGLGLGPSAVLVNAGMGLSAAQFEPSGSAPRPTDSGGKRARAARARRAAIDQRNNEIMMLLTQIVTTGVLDQ